MCLAPCGPSMTYHVDLTKRASRDLRRLYQDIDAVNSIHARDWFNGLEAAILSLDENPSRNPVAPENKALRHLLYGSRSYVYRVIYRIDEAQHLVTVLHIRHGSRQAI